MVVRTERSRTFYDCASLNAVLPYVTHVVLRLPEREISAIVAWIAASGGGISIVTPPENIIRRLVRLRTLTSVFDDYGVLHNHRIRECSLSHRPRALSVIAPLWLDFPHCSSDQV